MTSGAPFVPTVFHLPYTIKTPTTVSALNAHYENKTCIIGSGVYPMPELLHLFHFPVP